MIDKTYFINNKDVIIEELKKTMYTIRHSGGSVTIFFDKISKEYIYHPNMMNLNNDQVVQWAECEYNKLMEDNNND